MTIINENERLAFFQVWYEENEKTKKLVREKYFQNSQRHKSINLETAKPKDDLPMTINNQLPQTKHTSELLTIMNEAIAEYWENHDPENPPTLAILEVWFKEKGYNRSKVEIEAIDKIMRPDRYKCGKKKS